MVISFIFGLQQKMNKNPKNLSHNNIILIFYCIVYILFEKKSTQKTFELSWLSMEMGRISK